MMENWFKVDDVFGSIIRHLSAPRIYLVMIKDPRCLSRKTWHVLLEIKVTCPMKAINFIDKAQASPQKFI